MMYGIVKESKLLSLSKISMFGWKLSRCLTRVLKLSLKMEDGITKCTDFGLIFLKMMRNYWIYNVLYGIIYLYKGVNIMTMEQKTIEQLNEIARSSKYGFIALSELNASSDMRAIVYDDIGYDDSESKSIGSDKIAYPMVYDYCLFNNGVPRIFSMMDEILSDYYLRAFVVKSKDEIYAEILSEIDMNFCIIIKDGKWESIESELL